MFLVIFGCFEILNTNAELEKLVAEYGFGNVNLSALMKAANIEANVFYRRYGSMENLYDRLAKQYDFWINDAIDVSSLNILGPKKFFAETFKTLYRSLSDNTVMQKLLLYEMSVINETTKRTAETRDIMNLNLIAFYDNLFRPAKINIKAIMANLIGGIYYLILHRRCAKTCTIDFNTQEGEKVFFEWIDFLTDVIFDKLEAYERNRKAAQEMLSDGISEFKICKYMGINKNDLRILLSK
ncbi:TetR/AcrR family transcriptional regulator [Phocaeicola coprocola]|uniref:TetR/AcrR family transcriptional regulator n=1 Tax=Phocaeicola coprocola TaxID=310298 RepID=UPI00242CDA5E|nr:TetR/AcrR family transcriptional regulator [Phocaeicola coprocola]